MKSRKQKCWPLATNATNYALDYTKLKLHVPFRSSRTRRLVRCSAPSHQVTTTSWLPQRLAALNYWRHIHTDNSNYISPKGMVIWSWIFFYEFLLRFFQPLIHSRAGKHAHTQTYILLIQNSLKQTKRFLQISAASSCVWQQWSPLQLLSRCGDEL